MKMIKSSYVLEQGFQRFRLCYLVFFLSLRYNLTQRRDIAQ